jgi:FKBP-type peptidyl-prolyl cis-trans isomerase
VAVCCLLTVLGGCGGDAASTATDAGSPRPSAQAFAATNAAAETRAAARARHAERVAFARSLKPNPWPEPGDTAPHPHGSIKRVIVRDVRLGHGPAVRGDEAVYVDYVKTYWLNGKKFDSSWGSSGPSYMLLPTQMAGIQRGMIGMRPGGRRVIVMPGAIADVDDPNGGPGYADARVDIVLRKIVPSE